MFTSAYAIDTISSCVTVFHGHNQSLYWSFYLSQHSLDGYEAMGFNVTQLTQDVEQSLFTIKTSMPIPVLVWGCFPVGKIRSSHSTIESRFDKP